MASDLVTESFNKAFTEARALYDADKLDEAVAKAEELLEDDGMDLSTFLQRKTTY
jgi:hypothetical protein